MKLVVKKPDQGLYRGIGKSIILVMTTLTFQVHAHRRAGEDIKRPNLEIGFQTVVRNRGPRGVCMNFKHDGFSR